MTRKSTTPKCLKCGKSMREIKDKVEKRYTGKLWRCSCMPKKTIKIGGLPYDNY